jgi:hypothetical protein
VITAADLWGCEMMVTDINALRRWNTLAGDIRQRILANVFCPNCVNTTIVDYDIVEDGANLVIEGKCKTCGSHVARFVEDV